MEHPDRKARPVTAYLNFDKTSSAWILALPGPLTGLSNSVFREAMAAHLCLDSPAVVASGFVGKSIGRRGQIIDRYGDAIQGCNELPGDSWRHHHDSVKMAIVAECLASGLPHDCEVFGLFSDLLPAVVQEDGELQWGRARQGLVPDFRLRLPTTEGPSDSLAELKICGAGRTWYPRGKEGRGTDRRSRGLARLYRESLKKYDARFHGTARDQTGPLVHRLESYGLLWGLVVGPWGDSSLDFHQLIRILGEQRVLKKERSSGMLRGEETLCYSLIIITSTFLI